MTVHVFSSENASQMYLDALITLIGEGKGYAPRGKSILEIRPAILEYKDPKIRTTFLKGRTINPFFQLAESFWILAGRSDVQWLLDYNRNMGNFSDDGVYFNAPYGERLRFWNKNDASGFIFSPIDQLRDVYEKIKKDLDTRQAYTTIYNPEFDNTEVDTVDRPCNLGIDFKVRDGKLDVWVPNRSNDLHWGTFGANLAQFATIQEFMASALGLEIGSYYQNSNSLHIYMDDYGAKITDDVLKAYDLDFTTLRDGYGSAHREVSQFKFDNEPRMSVTFNEFGAMIDEYFNQGFDDVITSASDTASVTSIISLIEEFTTDKYFQMTFKAMASYHAHKAGNEKVMVELLHSMHDGSWKVSCLRFLSRFYDSDLFKGLYSSYDNDVKDYIERKGE